MIEHVVGPTRETADVVSALQAEWDENAQEFVDAVQSACEGIDKEGEELWYGPSQVKPMVRRHRADELFGDLDDCTADGNDGANHAYGGLYAVLGIARRLGVAIKEVWPAPSSPECRECGCTDDHACDPPCSWAEPDLCSACVLQAAVDPLSLTINVEHNVALP